MLTENRYSLTVILEKDAEQRMIKEERALNEQLQRYGIRLTFGPCREQGIKAGLRYVMNLTMDPSNRTRGAGRKPVSGSITMEEAFRMEQQGTGKKEIAAQIGISLSAYYRRRCRYLEGHGRETQGADLTKKQERSVRT